MPLPTGRMRLYTALRMIFPLHNRVAMSEMAGRLVRYLTAEEQISLAETFESVVQRMIGKEDIPNG